MVGGILIFALWTGILVNGYAEELRRREFLRTWELVAKVPFFHDIGASLIAEVARLLRPRDYPAGAVIMRRGEPGDCMYFVVEGEVEIQLQSGPLYLGDRPVLRRIGPADRRAAQRDDRRRASLHAARPRYRRFSRIARTPARARARHSRGGAQAARHRSPAPSRPSRDRGRTRPVRLGSPSARKTIARCGVHSDKALSIGLRQAAAAAEEEMAPKPQVIALEEHYFDPEVKPHVAGTRPVGRAADRRAARRCRAGPHRRDGCRRDRPPGAVARRPVGAEDRRCRARGAGWRAAPTTASPRPFAAHPDRFAAFAMLPTADPKAAADELERAVTRLGFKGAMVHGLTNGLFLDDKRFWPIFERAQALDVPLYLHPAVPHPAVIDAYYKDYVAEIPEHAARRLGLHGRDRDPGHPHGAERRVRHLSAAQDHPRPSRRGPAVSTSGASTWRWCATAPGRPGSATSFCEHFWITTSGFFSDPALLCCVRRWASTASCSRSTIRSSTNKPGTDWLHRIPLCAEDQAKILSGNVKRLLKM